MRAVPVLPELVRRAAIRKVQGDVKVAGTRHVERRREHHVGGEACPSKRWIDLHEPLAKQPRPCRHERLARRRSHSRAGHEGKDEAVVAERPTVRQPAMRAAGGLLLRPIRRRVGGCLLGRWVVGDGGRSLGGGLLDGRRRLGRVRLRLDDVAVLRVGGLGSGPRRRVLVAEGLAEAAPIIGTWGVRVVGVVGVVVVAHLFVQHCAVVYRGDLALC
jgi:hypothetical protein